MRTMRRLGWAAVAAAALVAGCARGGDVMARFQPRIANAADNFQFQVGGLNGVSTTREYTWTNTGQKAEVLQGTQLTGGRAAVTVYDAALTQVYAGDLSAGGSSETITGQAGAWRIRVELTDAAGTVNFGVKMHQLAALPNWVNAPGRTQ